jgi:chromosome segregation ATPase
MNTPTPTPRTDAAWAKTFDEDEDQCRAGNAASDMRDECATLERELTALTTERAELRGALAEMPTCRCDRSTEQQCELSAKVTALTAERDQLRAALALGQINCDNAYDDLRTERDELRAELAIEREKVRLLRSALENLCDEQNGAPLETRRGKWQMAMDETGVALAVTEGAK